MGRLGNGSKFECSEIIGIIEYNGCSLINTENNDYLYIDKYLINMKFILIEENTIDEIRLFETKGCEDVTQRDLREYINKEIVPYLKQLNKEIQELKEK